MRVNWVGLRPLYDFWGKELKRFYQLETLAHATERMVHLADKFIIPSVQQVLGPAPIVGLTFELFQEGALQLIFRLRATNVKRNQAVFGFVVAKKEGPFSKLAAIEHSNLRILYGRAPEFIVRPFWGGVIHLPEKKGGTGHGRDIYAYLTQWLGDYHELGVAKSHQFYINVRNPQNLTLEQTEVLKGQMVEIIARTYDPKRRDCMEMPQIASGDFIVTKPQRGPLGLKLIACRKLALSMNPAKVLNAILTAKWDWAGRPFYLAPQYPETMLGGLTSALGADKAREWLKAYCDTVKQKRHPQRPPLTLEALAELGIE